MGFFKAAMRYDATLRHYAEAVRAIEQRPCHTGDLKDLADRLERHNAAARAASASGMGDVIDELNLAFNAGLDELHALIELGDEAGVDMLSNELTRYLRGLLARADGMIAAK